MELVFVIDGQRYIYGLRPHARAAYNKLTRHQLLLCNIPYFNALLRDDIWVDSNVNSVSIKLPGEFKHCKVMTEIQTYFDLKYQKEYLNLSELRKILEGLEEEGCSSLETSYQLMIKENRGIATEQEVLYLQLSRKIGAIEWSTQATIPILYLIQLFGDQELLEHLTYGEYKNWMCGQLVKHLRDDLFA